MVEYCLRYQSDKERLRRRGRNLSVAAGFPCQLVAGCKVIELIGAVVEPEAISDSAV